MTPKGPLHQQPLRAGLGQGQCCGRPSPWLHPVTPGWREGAGPPQLCGVDSATHSPGTAGDGKWMDTHTHAVTHTATKAQETYRAIARQRNSPTLSHRNGDGPCSGDRPTHTQGDDTAWDTPLVEGQ